MAGMDRVSRGIFGIIAAMFLLFGLLPVMMNILNTAPQPDPVLTGASYLLVFSFVIISLYAGFKSDDDSGVPSLPNV